MCAIWKDHKQICTLYFQNKFYKSGPVSLIGLYSFFFLLKHAYQIGFTCIFQTGWIHCFSMDVFWLILRHLKFCNMCADRHHVTSLVMITRPTYSQHRVPRSDPLWPWVYLALLYIMGSRPGFFGVTWRYRSLGHSIRRARLLDPGTKPKVDRMIDRLLRYGHLKFFSRSLFQEGRSVVGEETQLREVK